MYAFQVTAWTKHIDAFQSRIGQFVTFFELEVKIQGPGKVSIETGWNARVVPWTTMDAQMTAFATDVMQDS